MKIIYYTYAILILNAWNISLKFLLKGLERCSAVKSTGCSSSGPKSNSQQPHGGLHLQWALMPSSGVSEKNSGEYIK